MYNNKKLAGTMPTDENTQPLAKIKSFPTRCTPPSDKALYAFESDLFSLINSISFKRRCNDFQRTLKKDICLIKRSNKIILFSDKTNNLYKIEPKDYHKLLIDNVTRDYTLCDHNTVNTINNEAQDIITTGSIKGKIPKLDNSKAYITIKDHKEDFPHSLKCRLINPSKSHIGKLSKGILDNINKRVREQSGLTQWKNTAEVLNWFNSIENKSSKCFVNFDIVEFYPSITKAHLLSALSFAGDFIDITDNDTHIIMHSCKSLLFNNENVWRKKASPDLFDVTMGSFHGAEVCDLMGLYILSKLTPVIGNCGLYRDDGLAAVDMASGFKYERLRRTIFKITKDMGFRITLQIGHTRTDFLDVSLDLFRDSYMPYRKPNSSTTYINCKSNHPNHIKCGLPLMIGKRLAALSKDEGTYNEAKPFYRQALKKSGFPFEIRYGDCVPVSSTPEVGQRNTKRNNHKRQIIYFNPPFCASVTTNIGKEFFKLVDKHFPRNHIYHPILSRKTIKLSYSCMPNMMSIIKGHNNSTLNKYYAKHGRDSLMRKKRIKVGVMQHAPVNDSRLANPAGCDPNATPITGPNNKSPPTTLPSITPTTMPTATVCEPHCSYSMTRPDPRPEGPDGDQGVPSKPDVPIVLTPDDLNEAQAANPTAISSQNNCPQAPRLLRTGCIAPQAIGGASMMATANADQSPHAALPPRTSKQHCQPPVNPQTLIVANPHAPPVSLRRSARIAGKPRAARKIVKRGITKALKHPVRSIGALAPTCNCRDKPSCPLGGDCLTRNVIYKVDARYDNEHRVYIGSTGNRFKDRYNQHIHDFSKPHLRTATRLSEYVWSCVDRFGGKPELNWSILHAVKSIPSCARNICTICNLEKIQIASAERRSLLNRRSEMVASCPHFRRFYFS